MVKRLVAAAAMAVVVLAAPAGAQQYPPATNSLTSSDSTPCPGQTVDIQARTFVAGSEVTFALNPESAPLGAATSDASGVAKLSATIPAGAADGAHTIVAQGTAADGSPLTLTVSVNVTACESGGSAAGSGGLPRTGDDTSLPLARVGLGLAAAGGVVTAVAAKRRKAAAAA